jgi:hypothetical protein
MHACFLFGSEEGVAWYTMSRSIVYFCYNMWCRINIRDYPEVDTNSVQILDDNSVNAAASIRSTQLAQNSEARFHSEKHAQLP